MSQDHPGIYLPTSKPDTYESTPLSSAGWYNGGQHGGAVSALIVGHIESVTTLEPMQISRITVELFRVVPVVPLTISSRIVREGKKIQVLSAEVSDTDGLVVAAAMVQRLRLADRPTLDQPQTELDLPTPDQSSAPSVRDWGIGRAGTPMFHRHAIEMREAYGGFGTKGPGAIWVRMLKPIIAGQPLTPPQRAVAVADFPNGVSSELGNDWVFMNPDLTVHLNRYPNGEWVGLDAISYYSDLGRGIATGTLWDEDGLIGRTTQSLFLDQAPQ